MVICAPRHHYPSSTPADFVYIYFHGDFVAEFIVKLFGIVSILRCLLSDKSLNVVVSWSVFACSMFSVSHAACSYFSVLSGSWFNPFGKLHARGIGSLLRTWDSVTKSLKRLCQSMGCNMQLKRMWLPQQSQ